jgi:hypothetical protein
MDISNKIVRCAMCVCHTVPEGAWYAPGVLCSYCVCWHPGTRKLQCLTDEVPELNEVVATLLTIAA